MGNMGNTIAGAFAGDHGNNNHHGNQADHHGDGESSGTESESEHDEHEEQGDHGNGDDLPEHDHQGPVYGEPVGDNSSHEGRGGRPRSVSSQGVQTEPVASSSTESHTGGRRMSARLRSRQSCSDMSAPSVYIEMAEDAVSPVPSTHAESQSGLADCSRTSGSSVHLKGKGKALVTKKGLVRKVKSSTKSDPGKGVDTEVEQTVSKSKAQKSGKFTCISFFLINCYKFMFIMES